MNQQIDTNDRLYTFAASARACKELHHGEQIVLIVHRDRMHARHRHGVDPGFGHPHDTVDQRVLGMQAQVNEASAIQPPP